MTEEVKAAIDRYCNLNYDGSVREFESVFSYPWQFDDVKIIANAYIQEHDDTPLTIEKAKELCNPEGFEVTAKRDQIFVQIGCDNKTGGVVYKSVKTVGQLLALLRGLGVSE